MFGKPRTSKMSQQKRQSMMSLQKKNPFSEKKQVNINADNGGTNLIEENYYVQLQNPIQSQDPTVGLVLTFQTLPGQKKRFLDVQSLTTYLLNYGGSDFPTGVELHCMQLSGLHDKTGSPTTNIAVCKPCQLTSVMNVGGLLGYNVVYGSLSNTLWDISNVNTLTFKVKLTGDTQFRTLPSAQPITLQIKITRVIY